jgi:hypothetical protein
VSSPDASRCPCCGSVIRDGHFMCGGCWGRVPRPLAADFYEALRSSKRLAHRRPLHRDAYRLAGDRLRASQEAAIAAVTQQMEGASL